MCDGNYLYPSKGGAAVKCKAIILICGNKDPRQLYPNAWPYIEARFNILCLDEREWDRTMYINGVKVQDSDGEPVEENRDNNNN